jgi:hypothetical protein
VLVVNRKLRVANDVDEQDMGDLELDLFLDLNGHLVGRLFLSTSRDGIVPLLLSTRQRQSDMNQRNDALDVHDCCDCFLCTAAAAAPKPPVTFESPCECRDNHGQHRWSVKIDPALPPTDANAIQSVIPSDIYGWPGPDVPLTQSSERTGIENNWFALTGRFVALEVETDGDLHIAA